MKQEHCCVPRKPHQYYQKYPLSPWGVWERWGAVGRLQAGWDRKSTRL